MWERVIWLTLGVIQIWKADSQFQASPKGEIYEYVANKSFVFNCTYTPVNTRINGITWTYRNETGSAATLVLEYVRSGNTETPRNRWIGRAFLFKNQPAGISILFINQTTEEDIGRYIGEFGTTDGDDYCEYIVGPLQTTTSFVTTDHTTSEASTIPGTDDGWTSGGPTTEKNNSCKGHCQRVCIPTKPKKNAGIACGAVILAPGVVLTVMTVGSMLKLWALPYEKKKGKDVVAGKPMVGINADDNRNTTAERQDIDESRNKAKTRKIQFASITGGSICVAGGSLCLGLCIGLPLCCCI